MFKVKRVLLPDVILNEGVNKLTRRKHFLQQKFLSTVLFAFQLLMLTQSLAPFAWLCSFCKFSIIGFISGLKFSLLYKFSFLSYFSLKIVIFSWVVEFLENILAFSLKQDLVYSQQSLAEERLLCPWSRQKGSYKIRFVYPSFHLPIGFLGISSLVFSET